MDHIQKFRERQERLEAERARLLQEAEEEQMKECTFHPQINLQVWKGVTLRRQPVCKE